MHDSVASTKAPFLERYSAVQEDYSACKARLEEVLTLLSAKAKEGLPSLVPALPSRTPPVNHGGDAPDRPHSADVASMRDGVREGGSTPPKFSTGQD